MGVQLTLMMLVACVSRLSDDTDVFQNQLRARLLTIVNSVNLPPGNEALDQEIRDAARAVISNIFDGAAGIHFHKRD